MCDGASLLCEGISKFVVGSQPWKQPVNSESARQAVWDGLLEVSRAVHYYAAQKKRYGRYRNLMRGVLALSGTGALVGLLDFLPPVLENTTIQIAGAAIAVLVILDFLWDPAEKYVALKLVTAHQLPILENRYRGLWERTMSDQFPINDALAEKEELLALLNQIASGIDICDDDSIVEEAQRNAFKVEEQRYA